MPRGSGVQGRSGHTSEEEQPCLSHAGAVRASTCLVTGKSQPRSALPSVKWILAAPPLKQSRRSGAMAGALSHGSPAPGSPCESARPGQRRCPCSAHVSAAGRPVPAPSPCCCGIEAPWAGGHDCDTSPASPGSAATSIPRMRSRWRLTSDEAAVPSAVPHYSPLSLCLSVHPGQGAAPRVGHCHPHTCVLLPRTLGQCP